MMAKCGKCGVTVALLLFAGLVMGQTDEEYGERMAAEHAGDAPVASPATKESEAASAVETRRVEYARLGDRTVTGYLARPRTGASHAGLIVIHEWWGLNENIEAMTRRLAGEGYIALAVDLYGGKAADDPGEARRLMARAMQDSDSVDGNLRQAYAYLTEKAGASKVGTIGWCFGGGMSLRAALLLPDQVDATVIYYGRLSTDREALAKLSMPVLGLFGAEDRGIPETAVKAFESTMKELGKDVRVHVYEGANHAFANPSGTRYNAEAAEDAWRRTLAFLEETLRD